jgi:hypothetical protein
MQAKFLFNDHPADCTISEKLIKLRLYLVIHPTVMSTGWCHDPDGADADLQGHMAEFLF